jgi:hypothetical protein
MGMLQGQHTRRDPSEGLRVAVCESCGMPSEFCLSLGSRRNLRASAWFCSPPPPAKDSSVIFCRVYCSIVYILLRKNLLIYWKLLGSQVALPSSNLPLQEGLPRAGTSATPAGVPPQPSVSSSGIRPHCCKASTLDWSIMMHPSEGMIAVACELCGMPLEPPDRICELVRGSAPSSLRQRLGSRFLQSI